MKGEKREILTFIERVRDLGDCMEDICCFGGCWRFYLLLKTIWPEALPYYNCSHVITRIGNHFYDITGLVVDKRGFLPMDTAVQRKAHKWKPQYKIRIIAND